MITKMIAWMRKAPESKSLHSTFCWKLQNALLEYIKLSDQVFCWIDIHLFVQYVSRHYSDVIMSAMASEITSLTSVYSTVYSASNQRKYQSSASLAFVRGIHQWLVNSPCKGPVTRKMFPFDDVIMELTYSTDAYVLWSHWEYGWI